MPGSLLLNALRRSPARSLHFHHFPQSQSAVRTSSSLSASTLHNTPPRHNNNNLQGQWRFHSSATTSRRQRPGARRSPQREAELRERNKTFAAWMLAIAFGTMGLSYASVPLYRVFCQVTGFGGTVRREGDEGDGFVTAIDEAKIVEDRPIRIRFNADVSAKMPWRFTPSQSEVVVLPGETALAFYVARNTSSEPITGIATYNVTPTKAGIYFNKVQCFCFDEQRLKPGEALDMPVFFFIDPEFAQDETMADVKDIMLSYTFFRAEDVTPEQLHQAQALAMGH